LAMSEQPSTTGKNVRLRKASLHGEPVEEDSAKELDGLTAVGSVLFNLDSALTR
jgi:hypothetical protein